jgi:hypothetical protein
MRKIFLSAILFAVVLSQGCSTSRYRPGADTGVGYYERRISENHYEVFYTGDKHTGRTDAYDFTILRALEIGRGLGYEYMLLNSEKDSTESKWRTYLGESYTRDYHGYNIKVRYYEEAPKGRYLPEKLFPIRSSYVTLRHKYKLDK